MDPIQSLVEQLMRNGAFPAAAPVNASSNATPAPGGALAQLAGAVAQQPQPTINATPAPGGALAQLAGAVAQQPQPTINDNVVSSILPAILGSSTNQPQQLSSYGLRGIVPRLGADTQSSPGNLRGLRGLTDQLVRFMPRENPGFGDLMSQLGTRQYADGGEVRPVMVRQRSGALREAAAAAKGAGRFGDTILVHINPKEFAELEAAHGPHTINPETGLPEFGFFSFLGKALKVIAPIAAMAIPGLGAAVGGALGLSGALGSTVGSALVGAGLGAATGGGKGALIGGITGGLGSAIGPSITGALAPTLGAPLAGALTNAAIGAGGAAAAGGNPLTGALLSGGLSLIAPETTSKLQNLFGPSTGNIASDAAAGQVQPAISDAGAAASMAPGQGGTGGGSVVSPVSLPTPAQVSGAAGGGGSPSGGSILPKALSALLLASALGGDKSGPGVQTTPPPAQPKQPGWDWTGPVFPGGFLTEGPWNSDWVARHTMNAAKGGRAHKMEGQQQGALAAASPSARAGSIHGPGGGQDDLINAKLSDGEHVFDASVVSALGDGSNNEGHKRLEALKSEIRKNAGKSNPKHPPKKQPGALGMLAKAKGGR